MPAQLIFASVPSGRSPGRSGYCTAARSRSLGERIVAEIERHSAHEPGLGEAYAFRLLRAGNENIAVLTRYVDAGADYTGRASTLAHHLVFSAAECEALTSPADIALRFTGWRDRWDEPAAWLDDGPAPLADEPTRLPAEHWRRLTGDAGHATALADDGGNPRAGTTPAGDPKATLRLFAESALLLRDRGWSAPFTTRDAAHDPGSLWRPGTGPVAAGKAEGRRAVMARTGMLPGARPEPARKAVHHGERAATPAVATGTGRRRIPYAYVIAALATAAIPVILFFALRSEPVPEPEKPPEPAAPKPATLAENVTTAMSLADAADWFAFHKALLALTPDQRELSPVAERVLKFRRRLIPDTLAELAARTVTAAVAPSPAERTEVRSRIDAMHTIAAGLGVAAAGPETEVLRDINDTLTLLDALDAIPRNALWITPRWIVTEETPLAVTRTVVIAEPGPAAAFLTSATDPVRAAIATDEGPGAPNADAPIPLTAGGLDFAPGKILSLRHAQWGRILELRAESGNRIRLTLRSPNEADQRLADPGAPLRLTLTGGDGKTACTMILNPSPTRTPITAPVRLLRKSAEGVSLPAWLDRRLAEVMAASEGGRSLLPYGFESSPRDHPRSPVSPTIVAQALRTRLARAVARGDAPAEISRLQGRIEAVATDALAYGAPWTLVFTPPGATTPTPLIRFIP